MGLFSSKEEILDATTHHHQHPHVSSSTSSSLKDQAVWVADRASKRCQQCQMSFSIFWRRHRHFAHTHTHTQPAELDCIVWYSSSSSSLILLLSLHSHTPTHTLTHSQIVATVVHWCVTTVVSIVVWRMDTRHHNVSARSVSYHSLRKQRRRIVQRCEDAMMLQVVAARRRSHSDIRRHRHRSHAPFSNDMHD